MNIRKRAGYTLVEVLAVIGIVISMVIFVGLLCLGLYVGWHFLHKIW